MPEARRALETAIRAERATGPTLRQRAVQLAIHVTKQWLDRWKQEEEPGAERLYRGAVDRFVELVMTFQDALTRVPGLDGLPRFSVEAGLESRSRFHYTEMLTIAPLSTWTWLRDLLSTPATRRRTTERAAAAYLERLLEVNSARIQNDFRDRVAESRRRLEQQIRDRLRELMASAERALEQARQPRAAGAAAVPAEFESLRALRARAEALRPGPPTDGARRSPSPRGVA